MAYDGLFHQALGLCGKYRDDPEQTCFHYLWPGAERPWLYFIPKRMLKDKIEQSMGGPAECARHYHLSIYRAAAPGGERNALAERILGREMYGTVIVKDESDNNASSTLWYNVTCDTLTIERTREEGPSKVQEPRRSARLRKRPKHG